MRKASAAVHHSAAARGRRDPHCRRSGRGASVL